MTPARHSFQPQSPDIRDLVLDLVNHLDAMVAFWSVDQVCLFANEAYSTWFGKTGKEVEGLTMQQLLGQIHPQNLPYIEAALRGEAQTFERAITTPDGRVRHSLANYIPYFHGGLLLGFFAHVVDVSPLKLLEEQLVEAKVRAEDMATHDFLTGLPNRVLLLDRMSQALANASRRHEMLAVMSLDIDDFKVINDTHGHPEGDRLLVEVAARVRGVLRDADTITRLGGDEFLILAAGIGTAAQAGIVARRVLDRIRAPAEIGGATVLPSVSIGIALYPTHGATPEELIRQSDLAMYQAKHLGKNRCVFAGEDGAAAPE